MDNCIFCGAQLVDGKCPNEEKHFKKMCLNCRDCAAGTCNNEKNKEDATTKMLNSIQVPAGYEIQNISLKPIPLKDVTKKCPRYTPNIEAINEALAHLIVD